MACSFPSSWHLISLQAGAISHRYGIKLTNARTDRRSRKSNRIAPKITKVSAKVNSYPFRAPLINLSLIRSPGLQLHPMSPASRRLPQLISQHLFNQIQVISITRQNQLTNSPITHRGKQLIPRRNRQIRQAPYLKASRFLGCHTARLTRTFIPGGTLRHLRHEIPLQINPQESTRCDHPISKLHGLCPDRRGSKQGRKSDRTRNRGHGQSL